MSDTAMARAPASFMSFFRIGLVQTVGFVVYLILPVYVQALSNRMGFGDQGAGYLASLSLAGIAVGTFIGMALQKPLGTRTPVIVALVAMAAFDLISPFVLDMASHGAIRFAAGVAGGVALNIGATLVARPSNAERGFTVVVFMNTGFAALMMFNLGALLDWGGMKALYWLLAGLDIATALLIAFEPLHNRAVPVQAAGTSRAFSPGAIMAMLAFGLFLSGLAVSSTYMATIGMSHGLPIEGVLKALAGAVLAGLLGAVGAGVVGSRFGRLPTQLFGLCVVIAMLCVMRFVPGEWGFLLPLPILFIFWNFAPPFFAGLLADYDPSGKAMAMATTLMVILNACAPALAAALFTPDASYVMMASILIVGTTVPLFFLASRKL